MSRSRPVVALNQAQHFDRFGCSALLDVLYGDVALPPLPDERRQGITRAPEACPPPCEREPHDPALGAERQQEIARIVTTAFFDAYLKEDRAVRCFLRDGLARANADVTTGAAAAEGA